MIRYDKECNYERENCNSSQPPTIEKMPNALDSLKFKHVRRRPIKASLFQLRNKHVKLQSADMYFKQLNTFVPSLVSLIF